MQYCNKCCTPITRPRVVFHENGACNACNWSEKKKSIDWNLAKTKLHEFCNTFRGYKPYNIIVPMSGGKDGSYVAWKMKHEFGMNPLCITFSPPMQSEIGRRNLENFRDSGFDVIEVRPNPQIYKKLCKRMFIEQARCKYPFVIGISTAIVKEALARNIPFIMYGEEGETEYGGSDKFENLFFMNYEYLKIYHEKHSMSDYLDEFTASELNWWLNPSIEDIKKLSITWWSKYESWDDKLHADFAKEHCGLQSQGENSIGTFTNDSQIDCFLQDLHMYEAFLKYGHGRATGDCNLAIKGGRMTRPEAVEYINKHEGTFPIEHLDKYLDFFEMTKEEFWNTIEFHANSDILIKNNPWKNRPYILKEPVK